MKFNKFCLAKTVFLLCAPLIVATGAGALTLDEFHGDGTATSSNVGVEATVAIPSSSAVGGVRTLLAKKNTLGAGVTRIETFPDADFLGDLDYSLGYTQGAHTGQGVVSWDGDNSSSIIANGLGSIDFTQDDGTAINLGLKFFDYPSGQSIDILIRLYDSTNIAGLKYTDLTLTLSKPLNSITPEIVSIPFSMFTTSGAGSVPAPGGGTFATLTAFGPSGSADITKVGAAQLIMNGLTNSNAPDLTIDFLSTNGRCTSVPNSAGKVIDECGVCLESTAANRGRDSCGVCLNGPPGYSYASVNDDCGLCPNAPNYGHAKDQCGVCFGDGTSCADCRGTPFGGAVVDACGVCGGDGNTCADCTGTPFGTTALDACNICGGTGQSCLDCAGTPFGGAQPDACGICGGTETNPANCTNNCVTVAATPEVLNFERRLLNQAKQIYSKFQDESKRGTRNKCGIKMVTRTRKVNEAYNIIRTEGSEIFNQGVEVCGNSCITVSYAEQVTTLNGYFRLLEKETVSLANAVKACYKRKKIKSGTKRGVSSTVSDVRSGLDKLVEDCRTSEVCPPH